MPLTEAQPNFADLPLEQGEMTAEFDVERIELNTFSHRLLVLDVLEKAAHTGIELGGDEKKYVPEDLEEEVEELRLEWMKEPDEPVTLTGETAELIYNVFEVASETEELGRGVQNEARLMLGKPIIPDTSVIETTHISEEIPLSEAQIIAKKAAEKMEIAEKLERMKDITKPSSWHHSRKMETKDDHLHLSTTEEIITVHRAVTALMKDNNSNKAKALMPEMNSVLEGSKVDFEGKEAKIVRSALMLVASGFIKNKQSDKKNIDHDRESARYILSGWDGREYEPTQEPPQLHAVPELSIADDEAPTTKVDHPQISHKIIKAA